MRYTYLQATDSDGRMVMPGVATPYVFLTTVYQGDLADAYGRATDPQVPAEAWAEEAWVRHNGANRPLGKVTRSMVVGDVIVLHDDHGPSEHPRSGGQPGRVLVCDNVGFVRVRGDSDFVARVRSMAQRGVPSHDHVDGGDYFAVFGNDDEQAHCEYCGAKLAADHVR